MKLSIGIVGMPNVGKSTLFKALTNIPITIANYPFATIDPNIGIVPVPDERLSKLAEMNKSAKVIPAVVEFYDIAGLVKGANKGEGLGNQFLSHIRETQAIVQVVRVFKSDEIIHVDASVNPMRDIETINSELQLKDLETIEKRLSKLEGEARTGDKQKIKDLEIVNKIKSELEAGKLLFTLPQELLGAEILHELNLLTAKKQIYLLNGEPTDVSEELKNKIKELGADYLVVNLASNAGVYELVKKAYEVLGLISFFTTGEDETRAWTIARGTYAPQAAGVIHTDFEKKFIRAEVIQSDKLLEAGGWAKAKQKGWLRLEGKEYIFQDGDVTEIRHG
ncbi:MAG: redox-regulated ATPase YchF [Candidatus Colwellbacteria bacterium]|nr:redox-regulated ATPase YchF [Candidatus Colwellbacteria bacterium]